MQRLKGPSGVSRHLKTGSTEIRTRDVNTILDLLESGDSFHSGYCYVARGFCKPVYAQVANQIHSKLSPKY